MDGICRCLASPVLLEVAGELRKVKPLTLGVLGVCELWILMRRGNPMEEVARACGGIDLHPEAASSLWWKAHDDVKKDRGLRGVRIADLQAWMNGFEGTCLTAWLLMGGRKRGKELYSYQSTRDHFAGAGEEFAAEFRRARDFASGTDILSSLDWPDAPEEKGSARAKDKFTPWKKIFRWFASEYSWGPKRVGKLTLWELKMYTCPDEQLGGTAKLTREEILERNAEMRQQRAREKSAKDSPPQTSRRSERKVMERFVGKGGG